MKNTSYSISTIGGILLKIFNFKSVKTRIFFAFGSILILLCILLAVNFKQLSVVQDKTEEFTYKNLQILLYGEKMAFRLIQGESTLRAYLLTGETQYKDEFETIYEQHESLRKEAADFGVSEAAVGLMKKSASWFKVMQDEVVPVYESGDREGALAKLLTSEDELQESISGYEQSIRMREGLMQEDGKNVISLIKDTLQIGVSIALIIMIFSIAIGVSTSRAIINPLKKVMGRLTEITNGQLYQEPIAATSKDEFNTLIETTNSMSVQLRHVIVNVTDAVTMVEEQSNTLAKTSVYVLEGTEQIASTMQEMAAGAESQASHATNLSEEMSAFANTIEIMADTGSNVTTNANEILTLSNNGYSLMASSTEQMKKIDEIVESAVSRVRHLEQQSLKISKLVEVIKQIAAQTNLLALNAAIEAARAGEHGKGFAVVANEVRNLAEQVNDSVDEITSIVTGVQQETVGVAEALEVGYKEVEQGTAQIQDTQKTFGVIQTSLEKITEDIQAVMNSMHKISETSISMNSKVQEIATISEESAAGVEETSAATQEVTTSMESVSSSAQNLQDMSVQLTQVIRQFKL